MRLNTNLSAFKNTFVFAALIFSLSQAKAQFVINDVFADLTECDTMTRGIYLVWWDNDFSYAAQVDVLLDSMISYRETCLNDMAMVDPPNPLDGYYYNVYIHTPSSSTDLFQPYGWGNGQGTDVNGYPFLTLPNGVLTDWVNNAHETFHIFQYNANSPGFAYSGDSQWYIEASANWFAGTQNLGAPRAFVEAESLVRMSHLPLWLSFDNYPASYPNNWQRYVHQYAMALQLYYLTDVAGVNEDFITAGFFSGTSEKPQEYLFNTIGGELFRQYFVDWAAHMLNDFDFITPLQASTNLTEWNTYADLADDNKFIATYDNEETAGWVSPAAADGTHAWSFNTYKLLNDSSETYTFEIKGEAVGNYGDSAFFQGQLLVRNSLSGSSFHDLAMLDQQQSSLSLNLSPQDTAVYFIVASMPEVFEDANPTFQQFSYEVKISKGMSTGLSVVHTSVAKIEIDRFDLLGKRVSSNLKGVQIILYSDGTTETVYNN